MYEEIGTTRDVRACAFLRRLWSAADNWRHVDRCSHEPIKVAIATVAGALILVAVTDAIARRLTLSVLRLLEGY